MLGNANKEAEVAWDILDTRAIDALVTREGASAVLATLNNETLSPAARVDQLCAVAVDGKIHHLREQADGFRAWAENHGLRRLTNALIELDRVLSMPKRGQAILQAQALTRFIRNHVDADVDTLKAYLENQ